MANGVTLDTTGLEAIIARTKLLKGLAVKAGFTGKGGPQTPPLGSSGLSTAQIMSFHEFGLGVPERATVRPAMQEKRREIGKAAADGVAAVLDGGSKSEAVRRPGEVMKKAIEDRIKRGLSPGLDPDTLNAPDSDNVLPLNEPEILGAINFREDSDR